MSQDTNAPATSAGAESQYDAPGGNGYVAPGGRNPFAAAGNEGPYAGGAFDPTGAAQAGYDAILPEGFPTEAVDQAMLGRFKQFCGSAGLSAEQAAKAVSFYLAEQDGVSEHMLERCEAELRNRWGGRYDERMAGARRTCFALDKRMGGRLMPLVHAGLGNHPAFGELMALVGQSMGEDSFGFAPGAAAPQGPMSTEEFLRKVVFKNR